MLAAIARIPELAIDKDEANALATGISRVSSHYDMAATQKSLDWANLFMALGMVYGPRIIAISARKSDEKKARRANDPNSPDVIHFPNGGNFQ